MKPTEPYRYLVHYAGWNPRVTKGNHFTRDFDQCFSACGAVWFHYSPSIFIFRNKATTWHDTTTSLCFGSDMVFFYWNFSQYTGPPQNKPTWKRRWANLSPMFAFGILRDQFHSVSVRLLVRLSEFGIALFWIIRLRFYLQRYPVPGARFVGD